MFKHILIPTDGSDLSRKAMLYGMHLAKLTNAKATAITVRAPYSISSMDVVGVVGSEDEYNEETRQSAERALTQVQMAAQAEGIKVETLQEVHDQPYRAIIDCALANRCDLIVMSSHGRRGVAALLLGSETTKVLTHSKIPVLVYR
jgi:nucleotide-binding universal stress UspA family protein